MPLDRAHILDWAKTRDDRFDNQIMLCKNHHGLHGKTISTQGLRVIKAKLAFRQCRYDQYALALLRMHATLRMPRLTLRADWVNLRVSVDPLARDGYYQFAGYEIAEDRISVSECWGLAKNGRYFTWAWRKSGDRLKMPTESKRYRSAA
jgi:hypothetical protein